MILYIALIISLLVNIFLSWYLATVLRKFLYISENMSDLFLLLKSFGAFVKSLYSMDSYYGEPLIQELVYKTKEVIGEMESFRDIFEATLDEELEEELDAAAAPQEAT